jgi:diguanylate cyclase (GGDEF)-like protein
MKRPKGLSLHSWLRSVTDHPYRVILVVGVVTLLFLSQIPRLRFETSIYDLEIQDLPATAHYQEFKNEFGTEEVILVVARTGNVFDPETFRQLDALSQDLGKIKGVRRVVSLPEIKRQMDLTGKWTLADFEKIVSPVRLFDKNILSQDRKATAFSLVLEDLGKKDEVIRSVQERIDAFPSSVTLYQIGMPVVSKALSRYTEQDFMLLPPLTFGLILLVLFLLFRNLRGVFVPAGAVLTVLTWTFGLMALTGTPLSMLTMIVPIFLIAVGTAYCMYIFPEYLSACEEENSPKDAALQTFLKLSLPTGLAVLTTTIGLGSLLVNRISAIRQFALFSAFGILSMLAVMLTFLPAVMRLLPFPKRGSGDGMGQKGVFDRFLEGIVRMNLHHQKVLFPALALVAVAGLAGVTRVRIETNPLDFFKPDAPVSRHFNDIYRDMAGSFPMNVTLDGKESDWYEDPAHLRDMETVQQFLDTVGGVDKTVSFLDYLKLFNYADNKFDPKYYRLPDEPFEVRMLVNNLKTILGDDLLKTFMKNDFSKASIMLRTHLSSSRDFLAAEKKIGDYLKENLPKPYTAQVTGLGIVISQSSDLLTEGQVKSLSITLILIFAIMFLLFMSWKVGFIGILPNCFPIIVTFGFMGWAGIPLSTATSLIATIAIGLAVDDTIHYLVRYNVEFKKNLDKKEALAETIRRLGKPMVFTTLTISLGFSILMASHFKPTAVFGLLMVITMVSALAADLLLLPSLMLHVELITLWDLLRVRMGKDPQKGIPLFDGLSRSQVHYILVAGALKNYETGEVVLRKGEVSDSMYAVISGELDVLDEVRGGDGKKSSVIMQLVNRLKTGDLFGEMGMIRACERSATVIATRPVELLQINDRMIKRLNWLYPPTARKFFFNLMRSMCDRLEKITGSYVKASIVDSQTGLHTRDFFTYMLEKEMDKARRYGTPLSVGILELENLDRIHQTHGYHVSNRAVVESAEALKKCVRTSDLLYRYDADKFAFMTNQSTPEEALEIYLRFRDAVCSRCITLEGEALNLTANVGVIPFDPARHGTVQALMADALKAPRLSGAAAGIEELGN